MIQIKDVKLPINHNDDAIEAKIRNILGLDRGSYSSKDITLSYKILKRSIDARKKPDIYYIYSLYVEFGRDTKDIINYIKKKKIKNISFDKPTTYEAPECGNISINKRPVIVGSGPAGLFCAYILAQKGFRPIVIERGEDVDNRMNTVSALFEGGKLNTESNIQFGEGGAGTFSDGKLNTLTKDVNGRNTYVLQTFNKFGAPIEITYDAKPHIGTDLLRGVVKSMREYIQSLGGDFYFNTKLIDIDINNKSLQSIKVINTKDNSEHIIDTDICVLALGHSARDTFEMLHNKGVNMLQKSFAVGFRVQHPQSKVDYWQYGVNDAFKIGLSSADYKVTNECSNGRRVYSFCMCPGGYVVNASSEEGQICVNGMSEHNRDSGFANSAIIASITPDDFIQNVVPSDHPLSGMYYQRDIEKKAYLAGNGNICGQYFADFEKDVPTTSINENDICTKGLVSPGNLRNIFSNDIDEAIIEAIHRFGNTRIGYDDNNTVLYGVEARTSSPVRISRDESFLCNYAGIYPCGEGAGYAGGITSAATDGIKVAEQIVCTYNPCY